MFNEQEIINGCKKYRHSAQKALYEYYAPILRGICMRYAFDKNEVKDILQEGFLKVFDKINDYKAQGSFKNWIKRIIINQTINHNYKNKRYHDHLDIDEINENAINKYFSSTEDDYDENTIDINEIEKKEINASTVEKIGFSQGDLLDVLNQLPEVYKIVFNLHCIEQYKHEEIAELLKIDTGTSRTRLLRARKIIKEILYKRSIDKIKQSSKVFEIKP